MCKRLKHSRQLTKHLPSIDAYQLLRHACSHSLYFPERVGHIGLQLGWGYNLGDGCRLLLFCSWLASRLACTLSLAHCHNSFCLMAFVSVCVRLFFRKPVSGDLQRMLHWLSWIGSRGFWLQPWPAHLGSARMRIWLGHFFAMAPWFALHLAVGLRHTSGTVHRASVTKNPPFGPISS